MPRLVRLRRGCFAVDFVGTLREASAAFGAKVRNVARRGWSVRHGKA